MLKAYDDVNYNSQDGKYAFNSYYDDYSLGAGFVLGWSSIKNNHLKLGVKNLFYKLYYYSEGFPMEGRRFYISASYRFNKK